MSKQTTGNATSAQNELRQPKIQALTLEAISQFALKSKRASLSAAETQLVKKWLDNNKNVIQIGELINEIIKLQQHFGSLPGLTPSQTQERDALMQIRKNFMDTHQKGEYDGPGFKTFISNERNMVNFDQAMQWWSKNLDTLKKLGIWEDINNIVIQTAKTENIDEVKLTARLHKLNDIKNEWAKHQVFAAFSSENLLMFYKDYLCIMESTLIDVLTQDKSYPDIIQAFLLDTLHSIKETRKQAIYSMFARLQCMEFYNDIQNDDILHYVVDRIEADCHIHLSSDGKKPAPRNGLETKTMMDLISTIKQYVAEQPNEASLLEKLDKMSMVRIPYQWTTESEDLLKKSLLSKNAVMIYHANHMSDLLDMAASQLTRADDLLTTDMASASDFILTRIIKLGALATATIQKTSAKDMNALDLKIVAKTKAWEKQATKLIEDVTAHLSIKIRNQIHLILGNTFSESTYDYNNASNLFDFLSHAETFDTLFANKGYDADKDVMLALATKLKQIIEKGETLTDSMIEKTIKLLAMANTGIDKTQTAKLREQLKSLPKLVKNIRANDDPYILHYITHYIEAPLLSTDMLHTALKRHQHIASLYNEPWNDQQGIAVITNDKSEKPGPLLDYIQLVYLPLVHEHPSITLENFDSNYSYEAIRSMEAQMNAKDQNSNLIKRVKQKYEDEIAIKLNNLFAIKKYLHTFKPETIQLDLLEDLINRVNAFFSIPEYREKILGSIADACLDLVKSYLITMIQSDKEPNFQFLDLISASTGKNVYQSLANDSEVTRLIMSHIELYTGANNRLGQLIVNLSVNNKQFKNNDMIYSYASKRLGYIQASNTISQQDYAFFHHFQTVSDIKSLFAKHRDQYKTRIQDCIEKRKPWNKEMAMQIELFADDKSVDTYRFYKIRELLHLNMTQKLSEAESAAAFSEWTDTLNPHRTKNNTLVSLSHVVTGNTSLSSHLDYAASEKPWSPLIESIITACGTPSQLQTLHFKCLFKLLSTHAAIDKHPVGSKFLALSALASNNATNKKQNPYALFIGESNIKQLCVQIERILHQLDAINTYVNKNEISKADYDSAIAMISTAKAFTAFYQLHGTNTSCQATLASLPQIESKIQLHQALHATIKNHLSLLAVAGEKTKLHDLILKLTKSVSSDNTKLHNLILTLTINLMQVNDRQYITPENTSQYMSFCKSDILDQINTTLSNKNFSLTFPMIVLLSQLTEQLPSDNLKLQLTRLHKQKAIDNPIWLRLINHMDDKQEVLSIMTEIGKTSPTHDIDIDLAELLGFARRLSSTRSDLHQIMKEQIVAEAGLTFKSTDPLDFNAMLQPDHASDKQLLALWNTCLAKLTDTSIEYANAQDAMTYIIRLASATATEILLRARHDSALLAKFIEAEDNLYTAHKRLCTATNQHETKKADFLSFWQSKSEADKLLDPLVSISQRTAATVLLHTIEKFILKTVKKDKLDIFTNIANDAVFMDPNTSREKRRAIVKERMSIQQDAAALAIAETLPIYRHAADLLRNKGQTRLMRHTLSELILAADTNTALASMKDYKSLLTELTAIANFNPLISNDREFHVDKSWKCPFSLQLS